MTSAAPVVLVCGAGTDRGFALARALLTAGVRVVAVDRQTKGLVRVAHGYRSDRVLLIAADITDAGQLARVLCHAREHFGLGEPLRWPYAPAA
ncbi:hypothetical protein B1R94_27250 [Mycolicibacterium litorale]|nr:hypothetical protein B1R94_27250 [Mycolicibacterium litorale]